MTTTPAGPEAGEAPTALVVGASRGLGLAVVEELSDRGWRVIGTVRGRQRTGLHELADRLGGQVGVEQLDVSRPEQLGPLHDRLRGVDGGPLDLLFVNAGTTSNPETAIGDVPTEAFVEVMITNALGPMRVLDALQDLVAPDGLIGAMTSGQGSIANNTTGSRELYRGSKAALNQFMRSFAARQ